MTSNSFGMTRFATALLATIMVVGALPMVMSENPIVDDASANGGGKVKVGWIGEFMNWNPLKADFVSDWVAYNLIFSTLFQYDENWSEIENHLAMDYYQVVWPSGNMSTYINITENAYFRNGDDPEDMNEPLTAEDVKFTFDLIQANPGNTWDYYLYNVSGTYVLNDHQVKIDTDYPKATLIDDLVWVPILPKFQWEKITGGAILGHFNPEDLIGSGAFYYEDGARNDWHDFAKAPNFHGETDYGEERDIDYEGIQFQIFTDTVGLVFAINSGDVDVVDVTGAQEAAWNDIGTTPEPVIKQVTQELGVYDIAINAIPLEIRDEIGYADSGNKILLDRTVRQAIGMTLNRPGIVDEFWGLAEPADTVLNPGYWHANLSNPLPFDPAAAKDLLISAGYEDTDEDGYLEVTAASLAYTEEWAEIGDELNFRLHVPDTDPGYATIGTTWVSWARDAGIYFDYEALPSGIMTNEEWYKCEYDLWVWSWYWGPEPLSNLACWLSSQIRQGGYNCVGPICQGGLDEPDGWWWVDQDNAELRCGFDDTFDQALRTTDRSDRKVLVDKLQEDIYETYTEFPPIHPLGLYAMSTARYDGWGNWTESVARTIISDMLWIWYDLEPVDSNSFPVFDITPLSSYDAQVDVPETFTISVSDPEGDVITVNWSSGDGAEYKEVIEGDTKIPTTCVWNHTYDTVGTFYMRVGLSDPEHVYEVAETATVNVATEPNLGPYTEGLTVTPPRAYVGDETTWTIWASDAEQGPDGEGILFTWDWGDGTFSTSPHKPVDSDVLVKDEQTHSWDSVGLYPVTVFVWDGFDVDTNPDHNISVEFPGGYWIVENMPPTVPATTNISGLVGQLAACDAVSSDPDPDNLRFTWDWGDGTFNVTNHDTSSNPEEEVVSSVTHLWDTAGIWPVEIWVDDGQGEDHNVSTTIYAHIYEAGEEAPPGSISITQAPNPCTVDSPVVLTVGASDPNEDVLTVTIDFDDDSGMAVETSAGGTIGMQYVEFSHIYTDPGTYTVTVYVDDGTSNISATKNVTAVVNEPPSIAMASSYSFYYNQSKTIRPVSIGDPDGDLLAVWYDWGDGSEMTEGDPDDGYSASHAYNETGDFVMEVHADDGKGNNVTTTANVDVTDANYRPTIVAVERSPPAGEQYEPGETIHFNVTVRDTEGDTMTLTVSFGDDTTPLVFTLDAEPAENKTTGFTHSYEEGRSTAYTITISVMDDQDHSDNTPVTQRINLSVAEEDGGGISDGLLLALAALAIILALIAAAILMKRKGQGEKPSDIDEMEGMAPSEVTEDVQDESLKPPDEGVPPPSE